MSFVASEALSDRDAAWAAEHLSRNQEVAAVCVAGSSARGDFDRDSDIDLLALIDDREAAIRVRRSFAHGRPQSRRVELRLLSETRLRKLFERRSTFAVHVLREGIIAYDPLRRFEALVADHSREDPVRNNQADLSLRLEAYNDLTWCQGLYLYCLSDFYSIGRAAVFTILGRESRFEFSASRAFHAIAEDRPDLKNCVTSLAALRPFFLLAQRDEQAPLPFPYRDSHDETRQARNACHSLVSAIH
jgi:predicted nucleotidyltransferase